MKPTPTPSSRKLAKSHILNGAVSDAKTVTAGHHLAAGMNGLAQANRVPRKAVIKP